MLQDSIRTRKFEMLIASSVYRVVDRHGDSSWWCAACAVGRRRRLAAQIVHRCLGLAVQRAHVHVSDVEATYAQHGTPGPGAPPSPPLGAARAAQRDAISLRIRTLTLLPRGASHAAGI